MNQDPARNPGWLVRVGLASRVSRRILAWGLAVGALGTLAVSWWESERAYAQQVAHLGLSLESVAAFVAPSLANSAWTFDRAQIETQLDAFTRLADVSAVSLAITGQPTIRRATQPLSSHLLERTVQLVHMDAGRPQSLGTLTLTHDLQLEQRQRRERLMAPGAGGQRPGDPADGSGLGADLPVHRHAPPAGHGPPIAGCDSAGPASACPPPAPTPARSQRAGDELDDLAASIAKLQATGRQALLAVDEEHALLRNLMDAIPDLVWLKDLNGVYVACNPRFTQFVGLSESQLVGKDDYALMPRELADFFRQNDRLAIEAGAPRTNEEWLDFKEGGYRGLFETIKTPMRLPDGRLLGVLGIARDVTQQRTAVEALRDREELYRSIVSRAGDGIVLLDPQTGRFEEFNDAACAQLGYSREEFAQLSVFELQADFSEADVRRSLEITRQRSGNSFEHRHRRKDGSVRPVWVSASPVTVRGRPLITLLWHDISSRQRGRDAVPEERRMRETIMESIPGVFYALDAQGQLVFWNRNFEQVIERGAVELAGMPALELFAAEDRAHRVGSASPMCLPRAMPTSRPNSSPPAAGSCRTSSPACASKSADRRCWWARASTSRRAEAPKRRCRP